MACFHAAMFPACLKTISSGASKHFQQICMEFESAERLDFVFLKPPDNSFAKDPACAAATTISFRSRFGANRIVSI